MVDVFGEFRTLASKTLNMAKQIDCDGFKIVKSKRNKITTIPAKASEFSKEDIVIDVVKTIGRIHQAIDDLKVSLYLEDALKSVSNLLQSRKVSEILCFELGHFAECNIAKYQLGFLLCLEDICRTNRILVHDPIFYKSECDILKTLGVEVIAKNNEGSYVISDKGVTIVYLPHCPKQLTNNFLWSNWNLNLHNCVLICNSFSALIENQPARHLTETVPYIYKIYPHTSEVVLDNNFIYTDIFNDLSIHHFSKENLENISSEFWEMTEKPSYKNTEQFITSLMIEKLNM